MQQIIQKNIIKNALYAGAILGGFIILLYVLNANIFSPFLSIFSFVLQLAVIFVFSYMAISAVRNESEDKSLSFVNALIISLLVVFSALLIQYIVNTLIMYFVDPEFAISKYKQLMAEVAEQTQNNPEAMAQMREGLKSMENFTITTLIQGLIFIVIETLIVSVIVALTAKKKERFEDSLNAL